jgi:hypothetical protein
MTGCKLMATWKHGDWPRESAKRWFMPLDDFQKRVVGILMPLRSPDSTFAGGAVLQRHGFRLSDDEDLFHSDNIDVSSVAERDMTALKSAGLAVDVVRPHEGLVEAIVSKEGEGSTRVQWVQSGSWNFFRPVPDEMFGWRLHMADLAINKALAAGGRRQVRDYADLALIHRHMIPLWHICWAAPGKDESWSPMSLVEKIAATSGFRQADFDTGMSTTVPLKAAEVVRTVRDAIEEAREISRRLPPEHAGKLFVDDNGGIVSDVDRILSGSVNIIEATKGGTWPSSPDIDHALIEHVIDAFGWEGDRMHRIHL